MSPNPYTLAAVRAGRARRAADGLGAWLGPLVPVLAGAAVAWLGRATVYPFLVGSPAEVADGAEGLVLRIGLLLTAGLSLSSYSALVRGPDRGVIDLHPLRAEWWYPAALRGLALSTVPWLGAALALLSPLWQYPAVVATAAVALVGGWAAGIGVGAGVNLAAPVVAQDPRWESTLDALRGKNPRLQAALIWAPGVALAISGVVTVLGTRAMGSILDGEWAGAAWYLLPVAGAAMGIAWGRRGAGLTDRTPAVLGEIDAAWAEAETPEDARRVYLEWVVRFVPRALRRDLLRELRHTWRGLRIWVSGSWGAALVAGLAGWSVQEDGVGRFVQVATAAVVWIGILGVRLGATDPPRLAADLGLPATGRRLARTLAVFGVLAPIVLVGLGLLGIRGGLGPVGPGAVVLVGAGVVAALGAWTGDLLRDRGLWIYLPAGALLWVLLVNVVGGLA